MGPLFGLFSDVFQFQPGSLKCPAERIELTEDVNSQTLRVSPFAWRSPS